MPDLNYLQSDMVVTITGGDETNTAKVSTLSELATADVLNNGGVDAVLTVGTSPVELRVGGTRKANRKYVVFEALDEGIKFGFSNTTQNIPIFKNQIFFLPVGDSTQIWFVATVAGRTIAIGEL
jgi:hypothetical protein